jgi:CheY-like chemotaxis protein
VTPKRILVAEDNSINKRVILRFLERRGHYCEAADNGEEALSIYLDAVAKGRRFDLIFMDIEMVRVVSCRVVSCCAVPCRVVSCRAVHVVSCRAVLMGGELGGGGSL